MKTLMLIVAALVFVVSAGCSQVKPPITARSDPFRPEQVHYVEGELRDRTAIGKVQLDRTEAGRILKVVVPIRATTNATFSIDYRVTFLDASGAPLGNPTGWTPKTLNANVFEDLTANSLTNEAKDFRMDIRYSQ
jgi:hypothetical protein